MTASGSIHMAAATVSLLLGAFQLARMRRDRLHRRAGYAYAAAMVLTNLTALLIYEFTRGFNIFHALALLSLFTLGMALKPMLTRPRPADWRTVHYYWVTWSYAGLCAAAMTEFLVRVMDVPGWMSAAIGTPLVLVPAAWLIARYAPRRAPRYVDAGR